MTDKRTGQQMNWISEKFHFVGIRSGENRFILNGADQGRLNNNHDLVEIRQIKMIFIANIH